MKKTILAAGGMGLLALAACHNTARERTADNIEANAERVADNIEEAAGNMNSAAASNMQNRADAVRARGDNMAADMRTHDPDTNLHNGI